MSCGREGLFCAGYLGMGPAFSRELEEGTLSDTALGDTSVMNRCTYTLHPPTALAVTIATRSPQKRRFFFLIGTGIRWRRSGKHPVSRTVWDAQVSRTFPISGLASTNTCNISGIFFLARFFNILKKNTKKNPQGKGWSPGTAKFVGCVGAGVIAATLSHPMDTIKTCMQGDVQRKVLVCSCTR